MQNESTNEDEIQVILDLLGKSKLSTNESVFGINAEWLDTFKRSTGFNCAPTGELVGKIDNSGIVNYFEKQLNKDFYIISLPVWTGLLKLYGGGPAVEIEVGFDPKNCEFVPLVQLHSFKIHFGEKVEKVFISKFKSVRCLLEMACAKFGLEKVDNYRLRDYWQRKAGRYLMPSLIICEYSLFVNTEMLLEEGSYAEIDDVEENSKSNSISQSSTKTSTSQMKAAITFMTNPRMLMKPDFQAAPIALRRKSHQMKAAKQPINHLQRLSMKSGAGQSDRNSNSYTDKMKLESGGSEINEEIEVIPGIKQIIDTGTMSPLNPILQCLVHIKLLKDSVIIQNLSQGTNSKGKMQQKAAPADSFIDFIHSYYDDNEAVSDSSNIKAFIEKNSLMASSYNQQDANEVFNALIDFLNESSKGKIKPSQFTVEDDEGMRKWNEHIRNNDSVYAKLFHGQIELNTVCSNCKTKVVSYRPFTSLVLALPPMKTHTHSFTFVPFDQKLPKLALKIKLNDRIQYRENFGKALDETLGRHIECVYGMHNSDGKIEWIPGPDAITGSKTLVAYEVPDLTKNYVPIRLAIKTTKFLSSMRVVDGPFLLPIPSAEIGENELEDLVNDYFSYLYEPSTNNCINQEIAALIPFFKENKETSKKIEIEKSIFSKTMKFKPTPGCPSVASREITAIIQKSAGLSWSKVMRQTVKNTSAPTNDVVDIQTLIKNATTPSVYSEPHRCVECRKSMKPDRFIRILHLPPILAITIKRFEAGKSSRKNTTPVTYPDTLELSDIEGTKKYELSSVCEHDGKTFFGNYSAHAKIDEETWAEFNDTSATKCKPESSHQQSAYMLFYTQKGE